ncbi:cis-prenyltransferase, partial [Genlisea aurea]
LLEWLFRFLCRCVFCVLQMGPIPEHIAFIMDGNRRFAKKLNLEEGEGHKAGYVAFTNLLKFCYELRVRYLTIYAFSIDNFRRPPEEVQSTMDLIQSKIEELLLDGSIIRRYGIRVYIVGNFRLLSESFLRTAEKAMRTTEGNSGAVLSICVAYASTDEMARAVEECCEEKARGGGEEIEVGDIERHMCMAVSPDPDLIIRTSGETRLSNFLLWQSGYAMLYSPTVLWPEFGVRHMLRIIIEFQKNFAYLERKRKRT